jgi:hypothetical protein
LKNANEKLEKRCLKMIIEKVEELIQEFQIAIVVHRRLGKTGNPDRVLRKKYKKKNIGIRTWMN